MARRHPETTAITASSGTGSATAPPAKPDQAGSAPTRKGAVAPVAASARAVAWSRRISRSTCRTSWRASAGASRPGSGPPPTPSSATGLPRAATVRAIAVARESRRAPVEPGRAANTGVPAMRRAPVRVATRATSVRSARSTDGTPWRALVTRGSLLATVRAKPGRASRQARITASWPGSAASKSPARRIGCPSMLKLPPQPGHRWRAPDPVCGGSGSVGAVAAGRGTGSTRWCSHSRSDETAIRRASATASTREPA